MLWTDAERSRLRELRPHMALKQIAAALGRPLGSVAHESARMKLFRPRGTSWTNEEMDRIAAWWPDYSASEIGEKLGRSRNAVIGVVHRVRAKLDLRCKTTAHPVRSFDPQRLPRPAPQPRPRKPKPNRNHRCVGIQCHCRLVDLNDINCRWPYGDPKDSDFYFCGAIAVAGRPYCHSHLHEAHHERSLDPQPRASAA